MELLLEQSFTVAPSHTDQRGFLKLSSLLEYAQQISGAHCDKLGFDRKTLDEKNLFWAVLRHRIVITRLPKAGELLTMQTWPMPTTRSAYPRATRALDQKGNVLFETVSLWVLMDPRTRTMVLPGKSGVTVPGITRENTPSGPGSLPPVTCPDHKLWQISPEDLDINGHANNAKYLDAAQRICDLFPHAGAVKDITVCYLAEARLGQTVTLGYSLSPEGILSVEGTRLRPDAPDKPERIFAVKATCQPVVL